jgi:outer membrane protein OmpA-like peptidoglycan-associated protein
LQRRPSSYVAREAAAPEEEECETCPGSRLQPSLLVGAVDDPLEREAERTATAVVGGGARLAPASVPSRASVQRCGSIPSDQCGCHADGAEERVGANERVGASEGVGAAGGPAPASVTAALSSPGHSMPVALRSSLEQRFGADFGAVRLHTDERAAASATAVGARAYTVGRDVVFGPGQYAPETPAGLHTLAHELAHVVQQQGGVRGPPVTSGMVRRQACPTPPTGLGNTPPAPACEPSRAAFSGPTATFCVDSAELAPGQEARLIASAARLPPTGTILIHGFASVDGPPGDYNANMSCHRANRAARILAAQGIAPSRIQTRAHGGTSALGSAANNRAVVIEPPSAPQAPDLEQLPPQQGSTVEQQPQGGQQPAGPANACGSCPTPTCPPAFCSPFATRAEAIQSRNDNLEAIVGAIRFLNAPAAGLFREYLMGGSATQRDLSAQFASAFTQSSDTVAATDFLTRALVAALTAHPPAFPPGGGHAFVDIPTTIPREVAALDDCTSPHAMAFTNVSEAPGLIAGGVGSDETCVSTGAVPSAFPDRRTLTGTAEVSRNADGSLSVAPSIQFTVEDTVDFCPGACGSALAQTLGGTVLMSRYEASGISGDIPFRVTFSQPVGSVGSED